MLRSIQSLGLELHLIPNKGAVMVLPASVDKATGLARALERLGIAPEAAVGVGDAENDIALLSLCGCAVAVANALPAVKAAAHLVTQSERGDGVIELAGRLLDDTL